MRRRLPRLAPLALAAFAAGALVPRATLVTHGHAGGRAAHVHVQPQHDPHAHPHPHPGGPALDDGATEAVHAHGQPPFPRLAAVAPPAPVRRVLVLVAVGAPGERPAATVAPVHRSRGPPPLPLA